MTRDLFAPRPPPAAHAFTVQARALVRWRGPSFDAYDAEARLGLAVAEALGVDVRDRKALDAFLERARITSERSSTDANPVERFDPEEGESWRFHVRLLDDAPAARVDAAKRAGVAAVNGVRNFTDARLAEPDK